MVWSVITWHWHWQWQWLKAVAHHNGTTMNNIIMNIKLFLLKPATVAWWTISQWRGAFSRPFFVFLEEVGLIFWLVGSWFTIWAAWLYYTHTHVICVSVPLLVSECDETTAPLCLSFFFRFNPREPCALSYMFQHITFVSFIVHIVRWTLDKPPSCWWFCFPSATLNHVLFENDWEASPK